MTNFFIFFFYPKITNFWSAERLNCSAQLQVFQTKGLKYRKNSCFWLSEMLYKVQQLKFAKRINVKVFYQKSITLLLVKSYIDDFI